VLFLSAICFENFNVPQIKILISALLLEECGVCASESPEEKLLG